MGCLNSKEKQGSASIHSSDMSALDQDPWPGLPKPHYLKSDNTLNTVRNFQDVTIDPRTPLSKKQVFKLLRTWRGVNRKISESGVEMFVQLFRQDKELQNMFLRFKDIKSENELRSNEALEYHATLVMGTIDDAIIHIDDYEYVQSLLSTTASTHRKFAGFKPENFLAIREPFLDAVRVTLGDRYTENIQNIYEITIVFILQTMVDSLKDR